MARPVPDFEGFIGQRKIVAHLSRQLAGAQARNEPFPHCLLKGRSGMGKTLLAKALAKTYGTTCHEALGEYDRIALVEKLSLLKPNDFLFVDECHRLRPLEQDLLMQAIDHRSVPEFTAETLTKGKKAPALRSLPPWTLVLATDQPGKLLDALLKRMEIDVSLTSYAPRELKAIIQNLAGHAEVDVLLSAQAAGFITKVCQGLPRRAKHLLQGLRRHIRDAKDRTLGIEDVRGYLHSAGISRFGLDQVQRRYLRELAARGNSSQEVLARVVGTDVVYLRRNIEGPLVDLGLVQIAPAGRRLSAEGENLVAGLRKKHQTHEEMEQRDGEPDEAVDLAAAGAS